MNVVETQCALTSSLTYWRKEQLGFKSEIVSRPLLIQPEAALTQVPPFGSVAVLVGKNMLDSRHCRRPNEYQRCIRIDMGETANEHP